MSLAILFYFLYTQHVSNINASIIRSSNTQRNKNKMTNVVIQQQSQAPDDGYINVRNMLST